jgi:DNA-binding transcriptional ArsR family regulator
MIDEITKGTADLTLEQCDDLLITGVCNIRDAILGYTQHGLTQPQISERVKALGFKASIRTIKRHVADLRDEGLLPAVGESERTQYRRKAELPKGQIGLMAEITPTTTPEPTDHDLPHHPAPTPQQQCVQADDWSDATVVTAEVVTMPDGERDFQRALELFAELDALAARNFKNGWTELQWNTLGGECRTLAECCDARGKRQRSRPQRQMFAHAAN